MATPAPGTATQAVTQYVPALQGEVLTPDAVVDPIAFPAHDFFNVIKDVIHRASVFHDEDDLKKAMNAVDVFEKRFLKNDHQHVTSEDDRAPHEDVSQRIPPQTGAVTVPAGAPAIDYNKLAQALMAAGFGQPPSVEGAE